MASSPIFRLFWYLTFSILTGIATFLRILEVKKNVIKMDIGNFEYIFLFGTLAYTVIMHISSILLSRAKSEFELQKQIKTSSFFRDVVFKFLFSFIIGVIFIVHILEDFKNQFRNSSFTISNYEEWDYNLYKIYIFYCLPIFFILELFLVDRKRRPNPTLDLFIILIVCVVNVLINLNNKNFLSNIGNNISIFLYTFDTYIAYDYSLFKINGGIAGFTLLYAG